ncbi:MAG: GNAT family N-acetyltransferase [Oxalicibacterium faecigallinarum]|uniref:GNAT family N-acetyltransferase n=1 Tax=Oxalicibacterium faecigallinarum TaxID=573741 RepID=UPI002808C23C|nr:GNAT family N-acetyltransferase [Oxalicibacterium faecigallinarum]MDQ7969721.1 GNAT family N-acetyltransferase [Oxalicibacterium faecigallinarum]
MNQPLPLLEKGMPQIVLRHLEEDTELAASFAVMRELRPHLQDPAAYIVRLAHQQTQGYRLLAAWQDDAIVGLAGYRLQDNLLYDRFIYVDDLVVTASQQRSGLGERLLQAVRQRAVDLQCRHLVLDTGLHMALAQRFYFRQGLLARGMHFVEPLLQDRT